MQQVREGERSSETRPGLQTGARARSGSVAPAAVEREPGRDAGPAPAAALPPPATDGPSASDHYSYLSIDRALKANLARLTLGLSPAVLAVYVDGGYHILG